VAVDPSLTYNFRVKWDGRDVAAFTSVSGLSHPERPAPKIPGQTDYAPVRLERGIATDREFMEWADRYWSDTSQLCGDPALMDFRKPIQIELHDQAGQLAMRWNLYNCWVSEYTALPELDGEAGVVTVASVTVDHEGWERDTSVTPPHSP
jgi:phage tail-like protein